ncbi:MAG: S24 family peptidase [Sphingomonas sp.]|uniref:S24 family peptidase n=1 Tax=Sphingomonas sp. TaxID=28214 RepID=UPI0025D8CD11|nr:S24 family peptidase [Sphingomonas sp.]MBX3563733.1 S24 family peptidase [Sphingomonas sp.]
MEPDAQRAAFAALMERQGRSFAELSRVIGRNAAYLQQYLKRGTPRVLAEADRGRLARYMGVPEAALGGRGADNAIEIARIDVRASAGPGGLVDEEARRQPGMFPPAMLRQLGVRPGAASMIAVQGDSMSPLLEDGDEILVDGDQRVVRGCGGVFVLRLDGELIVKRLRPAVGGIEVVSDNPAYPMRFVRAGEIEVLGRVAWLGRAL